LTRGGERETGGRGEWEMGTRETGETEVNEETDPAGMRTSDSKTARPQDCKTYNIIT